jgi:tRNA-methyltransferase O
MSSPSMTGSNEAMFLGALYFLSWEYVRYRRRMEHYETAYWAERRGRARVELEMKKLSEVQLNTSEGFFVQPIGHIESCYRQCVGTPRQGMLVPSSRASLVLTTNMSPESLDGLDEFSHVWLTFKFHLNTNTLKEAKAFSGTVHDSQR